MRRLQFVFMAALAVFILAPPVFAEGGRDTLTPKVKAKCLKILRDGMRSDEFWPSIHAAEGLTLAGHGDEVRKFLEPKLIDETDDQKHCGISRELVRAGDWQKSSIMFAILDKEETYGHTHACESLYKVFELGDGVGLRRALAKSENLTTRLMAAAALGRGGNLAAMNFLRQHLANEDEEVRRIAAWIIARIGNESDIPQLNKNLASSTDPIAKAYTEHALALLGDKQGLEALRKNLGSDDPAIRTYSATFAGETRDFSLTDGLLPLLNDETLDVRIRSAQSLLMFDQPAPADTAEDISTMVYSASEKNPRYTEGSIVRLADGSLLYAVTQFAGSGSDFANARIIAQTSQDGGRTWDSERVLQKSTGEMNVMSVTLRRLQEPNDDTIAMLFLEKNSHKDLRVYVRFSKDEAQTFGERVRVTTKPGYHVLNNDRVTQLSSGRLLVPTASTVDVTGGGHFTSRCWFSDDAGKTWHQGSGEVDVAKRGAMEPEVIELSDGRVLMIMRTQMGHIASSYSSNSGETWTDAVPLPGILAPEAPATLRRIPATGDLLLLWNNTFTAGAGHGGKRTPLTAAISSDEGQSWKHVRNLEGDASKTYSYISLIFVRNRAVLTYWDEEKGKWSSRFRSVPVSWFYADK